MNVIRHENVTADVPTMKGFAPAPNLPAYLVDIGVCQHTSPVKCAGGHEVNGRPEPDVVQTGEMRVTAWFHNHGNATGVATGLCGRCFVAGLCEVGAGVADPGYSGERFVSKV